MHLSVVTFVSIVTAFVLSATRILSASKWAWTYLPTLFQGLLPGIVVALPAFAQGLTGAQSWTDVTVALLVAGALVVPGIHSHTVELKKPNGPGSSIAGAAALLILSALASYSLQGCAWLKGSFWPKVENCAPSPAALVSVVETILLTGDNIEANLEQAGLQYGKSAVECAVQAFVGSIGASESESSLAAKARGREFLAGVKAGK